MLRQDDKKLELTQTLIIQRICGFNATNRDIIPNITQVFSGVSSNNKAHYLLPACAFKRALPSALSSSNNSCPEL